MSGDAADDLDAIRRRKRERLEAGLDADSGTNSNEGTPTEPIAVDGADSFDGLCDRYDVVLADFSATWCGPCRTLEPIVERVAARAPGVAATIDIDANPDLARQYSVRSVPTLLVFADGEPVERLVGVQDESVLVDLIERYA